MGFLGARRYELDMKVNEYTLATVMDFSWEACCFQWRSPLWLYRYYPLARGSLGFGIAAICDVPPKPLVDIAAEHGFWQLDGVFWRSLAHHMGLGMMSGKSVCQVCLELAMKIRECSAERALQCLGHKSGLNESATMFYEELAEIDEDSEALDKYDIKELEDTKK